MNTTSDTDDVCTSPLLENTMSSHSSEYEKVDLQAVILPVMQYNSFNSGNEIPVNDV